jgi:hypothetical protein
MAGWFMYYLIDFNKLMAVPCDEVGRSNERHSIILFLSYFLFNFELIRSYYAE